MHQSENAYENTAKMHTFSEERVDIFILKTVGVLYSCTDRRKISSSG
jgi:hypothetical protein